jgi:hypothetical protein
MQNWTYQKTISPAEVYAVEYRIKVGDSFETRSDQVSFASTSEVVTEYTTIEYVDKDGKRQTQDVVANTISTTTTCVGAANPTRWKSKLEAGSPAFPGSLLTKRTETFNKYLITQDGPIEREVTTYEYEPTIAFAGGLAIENYKDIDLGVGNILARKTIVEKEENKAVDLTKQTTIVYQAWGATSAGKTVASVIMAGLKRATESERISGTYTLVARMSSLVSSGVEKTINIGRGAAAAQPGKLDQQNGELEGAQNNLRTNGGWNQYGQNGDPYKNQYSDLSFGSTGTNSTVVYDMQFAPDSYLRPAADAGDNGTGLNYIYVSSATAAYQYGKAIHYILSGMANGKSITTELRNIPSEPMGTLYLEAAGTVGRFRANGTTFAWDAQGLVVGCDAMLDGGAGLVTGASGADWFPMMVPATNLPTVTATVNNNPALANTINPPTGFDPMAPGNIWASFGTTGVDGDVYAADLTRASVVTAVAENVRRESVSRSLTWVLEAPYSLTTTTENITSVSVSYGTLSVVYELFAGSGSGVIADLSPASGGTSSGGPGALLTFTGGTSMAWGSKLGYGFTFTVSANKTIKGVGFYDENLNGLTGSYSMLLLADSLDPSYEPFSTKYVAFDAGESETVMSVPSGTTAALSGAWRRVNLASGLTGNVLTSGITYTLFCEPDNTANVDNLIKSASGVTMQSGTSFGQNYSWGTGYSPSTTSGDGTAYFGPMIFFE